MCIARLKRLELMSNGVSAAKRKKASCEAAVADVLTGCGLYVDPEADPEELTLPQSVLRPGGGSQS